MVTIKKIQDKLKEFNNYAQMSNNPSLYKKKWQELFNMRMSSQSANSFASYYRDMRSNTRKHRSRLSRKSQKGRKMNRQNGGAVLQGAPLDYSLAPGLNIKAYGNFPIEAGNDPSSVRNLDVYFNDSLSADCGVKDSSLHVPADMGRNQVGGRRQRKNRTVRRSLRKPSAHRKAGHRKHKEQRNTFRQKGGDLLESITARVPFIHNSSVSPNMLQTAQNAYTGGTESVPSPADPSIYTWQPRTHGVGGLINPGLVAYVPNDVGKLAIPAPWMSSQ